MKEILAVVAVGVLIALFVSFSSSDSKQMQEHLGETVIIDGDTSTVVDYSTWSNTYTLGNGKTISEELIKNK